MRPVLSGSLFHKYIFKMRKDIGMANQTSGCIVKLLRGNEPWLRYMDGVCNHMFPCIFMTIPISLNDFLMHSFNCITGGKPPENTV